MGLYAIPAHVRLFDRSTSAGPLRVLHRQRPDVQLDVLYQHATAELRLFCARR